VFLIWGFRLYRTVLATFVYVCDSCSTPAAHHLVKRVRKFTLFFIPLFPVGTKYDTCTMCGRVTTLTKEQVDTALTAGDVAEPSRF
jgi:hypothetical protein